MTHKFVINGLLPVFSQYESFRTSIAPNGRHPDWNETFTFHDVHEKEVRRYSMLRMSVQSFSLNSNLFSVADSFELSRSFGIMETEKKNRFLFELCSVLKCAVRGHYSCFTLLLGHSQSAHRQMCTHDRLKGSTLAMGCQQLSVSLSCKVGK